MIKRRTDDLVARHILNREKRTKKMQEKGSREIKRWREREERKNLRKKKRSIRREGTVEREINREIVCGWVGGRERGSAGVFHFLIFSLEIVFVCFSGPRSFSRLIMLASLTYACAAFHFHNRYSRHQHLLKDH